MNQLLKIKIKPLKPRYHKNIYKIPEEKFEPENKIESVIFIEEKKSFEIPISNITNDYLNNLNNSSSNNKTYNDIHLDNKSFKDNITMK